MVEKGEGLWREEKHSGRREEEGKIETLREWKGSLDIYLRFSQTQRAPMRDDEPRGPGQDIIFNNGSDCCHPALSPPSPLPPNRPNLAPATLSGSSMRGVRCLVAIGKMLCLTAMF